MKATNNKAGTLWKMGMLQEAVNEYSELLADLSLPVAMQVKALANLSEVHRSRGNLFEARLHAQEGLRLSEEAAIPRSQAFLNRTLGNILDDLHERAATPDDRGLRTALRHHEKSSQIFRSLGLDVEAAMNAVNSGAIHARLGNFIVGLKLVREGLAECEKHGNKYNIAFALKELGRVYFWSRNYQKAKDYLFDCERLAERQGYLDLLFMCFFYLREIELAHGGLGLHETKRLMRLRPMQEGTFFELQEFEKQLPAIKESIG